MSVKIYALLVIYNRACEDSPSLEQLRQTRGACAVIVDNSTTENDHYRYAAKRGFGYLSMGGNKGLAAAYNRGIAWIKKNTDATHVLLLDDDTTLPDGFLERTAASVEAHPEAGIFLPRVYDENGLLSPCAIDGWRVSRIADVKTLTAKQVTGINSGMVMDLRLFDEYRYDEGYFLDYIDHAFLRDMKARGVTIDVTREELSQQFFGNGHGDKSAAKRRLHIFKRDFRRFCGTSFKGRVTAEATIAKRRLKIALSR